METPGEAAPRVDPAISDTRVMYPKAKRRIAKLEQGLQDLKELAKNHAGNHEIGQLMAQVYKIADRAIKDGLKAQ